MSELLERVVDLYQDRPKTALLMSGSGSNARALLEKDYLWSGYDFSAIATDNAHSNAAEIARLYQLPLIDMHQPKFTSTEQRLSYFQEMAENLDAIGVEAVIYAGFMKVTSPLFAHRFPGVNVHPADLTIKGEDGTALYRGMNALGMMRQACDGEIAASVHVVDNPVDTGSVISVSHRVLCSEALSDDECHTLLKTREHEIFPKTLQKLAMGSISLSNIPLQETDL